MATGHRGSRRGRLAEVGGPWQELPGTQQTLPTPGFSRKQLQSSRQTILLCASFPILPGDAHSHHTRRVCGSLHGRGSAQENRAMVWSPFPSAYTKLVTAQKHAGQLLVNRAAMETPWLVTFRGSRVILLLSLY